MKIQIGEQEFEVAQVIEALNSTKQYEVFTPQEISQKFGSLHQGYEQLIEEAFEIKKEQGEKGIDFVRRAASKVKEDFTSTSSKVQELEQLKTELESKIKSGSSNEAIKKQNDELVNKISQLTTQINEEKLNFESQLAERDNKDIVRGVLSSYKNGLRQDADKYGVQYIEEKIFNEALKYGVKKTDNGTILLNEQKVARLNEDMTPITLESYASNLFEPYLEKKKTTTGTGTNPNEPGGTKKSIPQNIKSRVELDNWLSSKESGVEMYSKEWVNIRKEGAELPLE